MSGHLEWVDCTDCGRYVLAAADFRAPRCEECLRAVTGATGEPVSPPPHWFGGSNNRPVVAIEQRSEITVPKNVRVRCPRCLWRAWAASVDEIPLMLRVHERVRHQRDGWASGVPGGLTGRERRNRR